MRAQDRRVSSASSSFEREPFLSAVISPCNFHRSSLVMIGKIAQGKGKVNV